jgi:hypothetical protein
MAKFTSGIIASLTLFFGVSAPSAIAGALSPFSKGLNYATGWGNCAVQTAYTDGATAAKDIATIARAGARGVRIETPMPITPAPDSCSSTDLTGIIGAIKAKSLTPLLNILSWCYTPTASQGCYNSATRQYEPGAQRASYEAWLTNLVKTSGVTAFEIGDEPNLNVSVQSFSGANPDDFPYGWNIPDADLDAKGVNPTGACPQGPSLGYVEGVASYVAFLQDSYNAIKAADPSAKVIIGGISSWHDECFIDQLANLGAFNYADAVAFHAYPQTLGPGNGNQGASSVKYLIAKLAAIKKYLPIWITEYGWSTATADKGAGYYAASEQQKAQNIKEEWSALRKLVSGPIILYTAIDYQPYTASASRYGLF